MAALKLKPGPVETALRRGLARVRRGWCQGFSALNAKGVLEVNNSNLVVMWCPYYAVGRNFGAVEILRKFTRKHVPDWSDAPGRKKSEVIDLFRRAISDAKAKGI